MKTSILLTLLASTLLTAACGKDSDNSKSKSTLFHQDTGEGFCAEVVQEDLAARGFGLPPDVSPGACPQNVVLKGSVTATRYASCPTSYGNGAPMTAVFYTKFLNDDGEVADMTLFSPQYICQEFVD